MVQGKAYSYNLLSVNTDVYSYRCIWKQDIPYVSASTPYSKYVMRNSFGQQADHSLVSAWYEALPTFGYDCTHHVSDQICAIHLYRIGSDERSSTENVIISTKDRCLTDKEKKNLQEILKLHLVEFYFESKRRPTLQLMLLPPSGPDEQNKTLGAGMIDGTITLPLHISGTPIRSSLPTTGASLELLGNGAVNNENFTTTLGCYLEVDGEPMILTTARLAMPEYRALSDPLFVDKNKLTSLMHPSGPYRVRQLYSSIKTLVREFREFSEFPLHTCNLCNCGPNVEDPPSEDFYYEVSEKLMDIPPRSWFKQTYCTACPLLQYVVTDPDLVDLSDKFQPVFFADEVARGWRGCRVYNDREPREMDWVLYSVRARDRVCLMEGSQHVEAELISRNARPPKKPKWPHQYTVEAGALIKARGCRGGVQLGQISTTPSLILARHPDQTPYWTQEMTVLSRANATSHGRIRPFDLGPEDSGALCFGEKKTEARLYGMFRCYGYGKKDEFRIVTPFNEILDDIAEQTGMEVVFHRQGQFMPWMEQPEEPREPVYEELPDVEVGDEAIEEFMNEVEQGGNENYGIVNEESVDEQAGGEQHDEEAMDIVVIDDADDSDFVDEGQSDDDDSFHG